MEYHHCHDVGDETLHQVGLESSRRHCRSHGASHKNLRSAIVELHHRYRGAGDDSLRQKSAQLHRHMRSAFHEVLFQRGKQLHCKCFRTRDLRLRLGNTLGYKRGG